MIENLNWVFSPRTKYHYVYHINIIKQVMFETPIVRRLFASVNPWDITNYRKVKQMSSSCVSQRRTLLN